MAGTGCYLRSPGGEVQGHRQLRGFVRRNRQWLGERHATTESVASTCSGNRAVVEILAHLVADDGNEVDWPLAVVAESVDDRSVVFRTYCSQRPMVGEHRLRPAILDPDPTDLNDVVGRYQVALRDGDIDAIVATFAADGYLREPLGPSYSHRGTSELRSYFAQSFSGGGGIALEQCCITDDGVRSAFEYNCVRWGATDLPPKRVSRSSSDDLTVFLRRCVSTTTSNHGWDKRQDEWRSK